MINNQDIDKVHISTLRKSLITAILFLFVSASLFSQNQRLADSLETIYINGDFEEEYRLRLLKRLAREHPINESKIKYSNELLSWAKEKDSSEYFYNAYFEKGNAFKEIGDHPMAIENYLNAGDEALKNNNKNHLSAVYSSIATVYNVLGDTKTATSYLKKEIEFQKNPEILKSRTDTSLLATSIHNLGYFYISMNEPDSAIIYLNESEELFEKINYEMAIAYVLGNKGLAYAQLKNYNRAEKYLNNAFQAFEKNGHYSGICEFLMEISEIYWIKDDFKRASEFALRSLKLAEEHNLKSEISEANLHLSKIYEKTGQDKKSLAFYKNYIIYRDSVINLSSIQEIANMRTDFEVAQKQTEIDLKQSEVELLNQQKSNLRILAFSMVALLGLTGFYFRNIRKAKRRSDDLLLNILPSSTAQELKEHGKVKAKKFDEVTVMFTDFQAFTRYSQNLSPEVLVKSVDYFFSKFDQIIDAFKLEKIKTIGDAYMCAGGLTNESKNQVIKIIEAAFKIKKFVEETKKSSDNGIAHFNIRIGVNTGPVVAGVVGKNKFAYDIWGDTVNVASRMESNSEAGKINISENTYQLIKDHYDCEYRGQIDVKNKGMMKMYFVVQPKNKRQISVQDQSLEVLC